MSSAMIHPRLMLRQTRLLNRQAPRRYASTTEEAANKAKEATANVQSKASQGLSKVTSSAGPALSGAASKVGNALSGIGGRTGRLIKFVDSIVPPTVYYSKVGLELTKQVFRGRQMNPPSVASVQQFVNSLPQVLRNPTAAFQTAGLADASTGTLLNRIRNLNREQTISLGVIGAELLGFFTLGKVLGRRKLVGYRGDSNHGDH